MIVYNLVCKGGHEFEAWFRDSAAYDAQAGKGRVVCPTCNTRSVSKAMMAPSLTKSGSRRTDGKGEERPTPPVPVGESQVAGVDPKLAKLLTEVRTYVEKNYDYVGPRFPEEARRIHYGETPERQIYGEASADEVKALTDEGVPIAPLPKLPRRDS
jgi:hypothetical protein